MLQREMVSRSRKHRHSKRKSTRRARGGGNNSNNNNNNNNYNNKEKRAIKEEPLRLLSFFIDAVEENDIDTLKIFMEQQQYIDALKEGLSCMQKNRK